MTLQVSQIFLNIHHHFRVDANADATAKDSSGKDAPVYGAGADGAAGGAAAAGGGGGGDDGSSPNKPPQRAPPPPPPGGVGSQNAAAAQVGGSGGGGAAGGGGGGANNRAASDKKAWEDTGLGIPETEVFDLFQVIMIWPRSDDGGVKTFSQ